MTSIRITEFGGLRDRNSRMNKAPSAASVAKDVKLWHGTLSPWRYPARILETELDNVCSLSKHGCHYLVSEDQCVSYAYDTTCNRVFRSHPNEPVRWAILPSDPQDCPVVSDPEWFLLGVPKPTSIPQIISYDPLTPPKDEDQIDFSEQFTRESRTYAISYVNSMGEEGSLSISDQIIDVDVNGEAVIGFFLPAATQAQYDLVSVRIYRGLPLHNNEIVDRSDPDAPSASGFFLVGEIDYTPGMVEYEDDLPAEDIGEAYVEHEADLPLEGLDGIIMLDSGSLAAFQGNKLWFSEPFKYHMWNCFMNFDHQIKAMGTVNGYIYLATNGNAYVLGDQVNEEECRCCRDVATINEPTPIASPKSFVVTPTGVMFATYAGLVRITGQGMNYMTLPFYSEDQWGKWNPHRLRSVYYRGAYFGFNDSKGFIFNFNEGYYTGQNQGEETNFTELSLTPDTVYVTKQNELILTFAGDIFVWNQADVYIPYTWRSRLNVEGGNTNLGYAKVVFEDYIGRRPVPHPVMFRLYADDRKVFERRVSNSSVFTLPRGYDAINFEVEIEGIQTVMEVHMATTKRELTLISNT